MDDLIGEVARKTVKSWPDLAVGTRTARPKAWGALAGHGVTALRDRKSTRLNSSHEWISYAVFCLKKKKNQHNRENAAKSPQIVEVCRCGKIHHGLFGKSHNE